MRSGTEGGIEVESLGSTVGTVLDTAAAGDGDEKNDPDETMGFSLAAAAQGHLIGVSISVVPANVEFPSKILLLRTVVHTRLQNFQHFRFPSM